MSKKQKQNIDGGEGIGQNIFGDFGKIKTAAKTIPNIQTKNKARCVVGIRREKQGRAGKWVTVVHGMERPLPRTEAERYLSILKKQLGTGGKLTAEGFELQGDRVEDITITLQKDHYRIKRTGA